MRIIGGLILVHNGGKNYTAKDDDSKAIGVKVSKIPLTLTKKVIIQILNEKGIKHNPKDTKDDLKFKLNLLYGTSF